MTAVVHLQGLWLNDYLDPASALRLPLARGWQEADTVAGEVRTYAGGRTRLVTQAGRARTLSPSLRIVTAAVVADVRARAGRLHWVRTSTGTKWCGVFLDPQVTWLTSAGGGMAQVTFTITEVSASEVV